MAVYIADLVGDWQLEVIQVNVPAAGVDQFLRPDPTRLALGISVDKTPGTVAVSPSQAFGIGEGILMREEDFHWYYWSKHGILVSAGWSCTQSAGGPNNLTVYVITQTTRR